MSGQEVKESMETAIVSHDVVLVSLVFILLGGRLSERRSGTGRSGSKGGDSRGGTISGGVINGRYTGIGV